MKKTGILILILFSFYASFSQSLDSISSISEIEMFQSNLNRDYADPKESPLAKEVIGSFKGHEFFPINLDYRVSASVEIIQNPEIFIMETSGEKRPEYKTFLKLTFKIHDTTLVLFAYQNVKLSAQKEYADYLFIPFNDLTNGNETYPGGRYIDVRIPKGNKMTLDFNQCYNPYCAYSWKYSCPKPPKENQLNFAIPAGIKAPPHD